MIDFLTFIICMPFVTVIETYQNGDWVFFIIFLVFSAFWLFLGFSAIVGIIYVIDSAFIPTREETARVSSKKHTPTQRVMIMQQVGKVMVPTWITEPEHWNAEVVYNNTPLSCAINKDQFDSLRKNQNVRVLIGMGRFSKTPYCKQILT